MSALSVPASLFFSEAAYFEVQTGASAASDKFWVGAGRQSDPSAAGILLFAFLHAAFKHQHFRGFNGFQSPSSGTPSTWSLNSGYTCVEAPDWTPHGALWKEISSPIRSPSRTRPMPCFRFTR